uniref:B-cell receptor CD22 n=1 Tax=Anabas testudineus TaxID=64144 RepID=A0A3Q1JBC5_ANATE
MTASTSGFVVLLLSVSVVQGQNDWGVTYTSTQICGVKGSTVEIRCSYTYPDRFNGHQIAIEKSFWFTTMNGDDPVALKTGPRMQYKCSKKSCTLRISNLMESDSGVYKFRFTTNHHEGKYTGEPGVTLSVTDPQLQVFVSSQHTSAVCFSSCHLPNHPSYIWYKNGQKLYRQTKSISVFKNYGDSYSCSLTGHEDFPSPPVCVNGQTCKRVIYAERSICASKGSSVDISCTYNSYYEVTSKFWFSPERGPQWKNPSQSEDLLTDSQYTGRVQVLETERGRSTLRITDLRETDSAQYQFTFTTSDFKWGSSLPGTTLTVTALQVQINRVKTLSQSYTEAELTCHSSCSPDGRPPFVWFKNGNTVDLEETSYKAQFFPGDSISCAFRGHEDFPSPLVYAPKLPIILLSPTADIVEGTLVNLTCIIDANPAADCAWYKNHTLLSKEPQFVFSSIQASESGDYYCTAENKLGKSRSESVSIDVKYAPKTASVLRSPSEIVEGSSVSLTCSSDANPAAKYTWYKNDQTLNQESQIINFSTISSGDRGSYRCKSENQYGQLNSSSEFIDVQYAPRIPDVSVSPSEIVEGSSVNLTCRSDANPAANYTWYKENEASPKASGQIFTITDIRAEHSGNYYCEVQNSVGRHNSTLHLTVLTGSGKSAAAGSISAFILVIIFLSVFLMIRKKFFKKTPGPEETPGKNTQPNVGSEYDTPSAAAQREPAKQQEDLFYATVRFSKNREEALYSNIKPAQPNRHNCDDEEYEEVDYTMVNFNSASAVPRLSSQEAENDSSALYSMVNKTPRV